MADHDAPRDEEGSAGDPSPAPSPAKKPAPSEPRFARVRRLARWIGDHYFRIDPRTAGLFRVALGLLIVGDALRHWHSARWAYSNEGVLSNHQNLFRPASAYHFSILHAFSTMEEVHLAFALFVFSGLCLLVGFRAKLFAIAAFVIETSIDNRLVLRENGGYIVVNLITAYAMFLPIERRFSVDAWLRSYREKKERTFADFAERYRPAWATKPVVTLAALLVILNLAAIYFFNVVNKSGNIWRAGATVHYVLWLNRMVTGFAVFFRNVLPYPVTQVLTWLVLCIEALIVPWAMSPHARRYTRPLAILAIFCLHTMLGTMMRLGPFSWFLIGWSALLVSVEQWDDLEAWFRKRASPRLVVLDQTSPLAFALGRVLVRLDRYELLTLVPSDEAEGSPRALVRVEDPASGASFTKSAALREILQAFPGGRLAFAILRVACLGRLDAICHFADERRERIGRFFGLRIGASAAPPESPDPTPLRSGALRVKAFARESLLIYLMAASVLQIIHENKSTPAFMRPESLPKIMNATLVYPRMFQGWGMFSPNPITDDGSVSVDAITISGRHVDPFTGKEPDLVIADADGLGIGQIQQDYFNRIRLDRNKGYRQNLRDYLLRYHVRTGRAEDEIVYFVVYWVRAECPPPRQKGGRNNKAIPILTYRKPGSRVPPGLPELPREPRVESADSPKKDKDLSRNASEAPSISP